ncbi:MAG: hypothetical protein EOO51_13280 [Flavobacterium sp.]|nr:MAG: hypothetical protein EOO51_13280 [Flavobacterium sp.]
MKSKYIQNNFKQILSVQDFNFSFSVHSWNVSLNIEIDKEYQCVSMFDTSDKSYLVEQKLPHEIAHPLSILQNAEFSDVEDFYDFSHDGAGFQSGITIQYKIDDEIKKINIEGHPSLESDVTRNEKRLFELCSLLENWLTVQNQKLNELL